MFVFDASALDALIDSYGPAYALWSRADEGEITIAVPATAVWEVGRSRGIGTVGWEPILFPATILVLPLTETCAVETGAWTGWLAACHVLWESRNLGWPVVTRRRDMYGADAKVLGI